MNFTDLLSNVFIKRIYKRLFITMKKFVSFEYIKQLLGFSKEMPKSVDIQMKTSTEKSKKKAPKKNRRGRGKK